MVLKHLKISLNSSHTRIFTLRGDIELFDLFVNLRNLATSIEF